MTTKISKDFELYYAEERVVYISSELRIRILKELSKKSLSLTDLVKITGNAQSTLSVHLDNMLKDGVIKVDDDPKDNRRKTYRLGSSCMAYTKDPDPESLSKAKEILLDMADVPETIGIHMPSLVFLALDSLGLSIAPFFEGLGRTHANALSAKIDDSKFDSVIDQLRIMYSYINFGEVSVFKYNPLTLIVKSNLRVSKGAAESFGMYARGFFSQALEDIYESPITTVSSEVFGAENNYYRFELDCMHK